MEQNAEFLIEDDELDYIMADLSPSIVENNQPDQTPRAVSISDGRIQEVLNSRFRIRSFQDKQLQAIKSILSGNDTVLVLATGGGKSLIYQLSAILFSGLTIVVCPLKSLIADQLKALSSLEISAKTLSGDCMEFGHNEIYQEMEAGNLSFKILYVTAERLVTSKGNDRLNKALNILNNKNQLSLFVVDEAHCISQWGSDFRRSYKELSILRTTFSHVPIFACTATATTETIAEISTSLILKAPTLIIGNLHRPNLGIEIIEKKIKSANTNVLNLIKTDEQCRDGSGLIYCLSREDCGILAHFLVSHDISAKSYHSGLNDFERNVIQNEWSSGSVKVLCCTIAFGMGIDKKNTRFVIHASIPSSIEGYVQEIGRAGRDNKQSSCVLMYNYHDVIRHLRQIEETSGTSPEDKEMKKKKLYEVMAYAEDWTTCHHQAIMAHFGQICNKCSGFLSCTNCRTTGIIQRDVLMEAAMIMRHLTRWTRSGKKITLNMLAEILKGSTPRKYRDYENDAGWACLRTFGYITDIARIVKWLICHRYINEKVQSLVENSVTTYLAPSGKARPNSIIIGFVVRDNLSSRRSPSPPQENLPAVDLSRLGKKRVLEPSTCPGSSKTPRILQPQMGQPVENTVVAFVPPVVGQPKLREGNVAKVKPPTGFTRVQFE